MSKHQILLPEAIAVLAHVIKCFSHLQSFPLAPLPSALSASSLWTNGVTPQPTFQMGTLRLWEMQDWPEGVVSDLRVLLFWGLSSHRAVTSALRATSQDEQWPGGEHLKLGQEQEGGRDGGEGQSALVGER